MKQKWENVQIMISGGGPNAISEALNRMGEEGWEAWHLESRTDHAIVFLKRPKSGLIAPDLSVSNGLARQR